MTDKDIIKSLQHQVEELMQDKADREKEEEIDVRVKGAVQLRCLAAWTCILAFISVVSAVIALFSDVLKDAVKAALKVIIVRFWS